MSEQRVSEHKFHDVHINGHQICLEYTYDYDIGNGHTFREHDSADLEYVLNDISARLRAVESENASLRLEVEALKRRPSGDEGQ